MSLGRTWFAAALLAAASSGCVVVDDDDGPPPVLPPSGGFFTTIDAGESFQKVNLGWGAAAFVEYDSGGIWTVWTSCDSERHGASCFYEIYITSEAPIGIVDEFATEADDYVGYYGDYGLDFVPVTTFDYDEIQFTTDPGAIVEMELVLDGVLAPDHFIWFGNGVVHDFDHENFATRSPVVFQPDQP